MIFIDQMLHGYKNGHSLLASSKRLSKRTERLILFLSDLSGPDISPGFETYITGYPLKEDALYAFSRTWYAPEMERPGCVWTHTLLLQTASLPLFTNAASLLRLFRKPSINSDYSKFKQRLQLKTDKSHLDFGTGSSEGVLAQLLFAISENPKSPILIASESSTEFEKLLISFWSILWPNLRHNFAFSGGSLSIRSTNEITFNLQVIPLSRKLWFKKHLPSAYTIDRSGRLKELSSSSRYTESAQTIKSYETQRRLRDFLYYFGAESHAESDLMRLVEVFTSREAFEKGRIEDRGFILNIEKIFPDPNHANLLKKSLLSFKDDSQRISSRLEPTRVLWILNKEDLNGYTSDNLGISNFAIALLQDNPNSAFSLARKLIHGPINELGRTYLRTMAEEISLTQLLDLRLKEPDLYYMFLVGSPGHAFLPSFWKTIGDQAIESLGALATSPNLDDSQIRHITEAVLEAKILQLLPSTIQVFGKSSIPSILNWYSIRKIDENTASRLRPYQRELAEWLNGDFKITKDGLVNFIPLLDPSSSDLQQISVQRWQDHLETSSGIPEKHLRDRLQSICLSISLKYSDQNYAPLLQSTFPDLYLKVRTNKLSYDNWRILEQVLPKVEFWYSWNRPLRMAKGLVKYFAHNGQNGQLFLDTLANIGSYQEIIDFCGRSKEGKSFLQEIFSGIMSDVYHSQNSSLVKYISSKKEYL